LGQNAIFKQATPDKKPGLIFYETMPTAKKERENLDLPQKRMTR
jgi:hypothetical protein